MDVGLIFCSKESYSSGTEKNLEGDTRNPSERTEIVPQFNQDSDKCYLH